MSKSQGTDNTSLCRREPSQSNCLRFKPLVTLFNIVIMTIIIFIHMIMMILASGSRILVARIIQFEVESNCATFLQMSIISHSSPTAPISAANVNVFSFLQKFSIISTQARHPHLIIAKQLVDRLDRFLWILSCLLYL